MRTSCARRKTHASWRDELIGNIQQFERSEIDGAFVNGWEYGTDDTSGANWRLLLGDNAERLAELADDSIDLSVFSPPFRSLYTYSPTGATLATRTAKRSFMSISHTLSSNYTGRQSPVVSVRFMLRMFPPCWYVMATSGCMTSLAT